MRYSYYVGYIIDKNMEMYYNINRSRMLIKENKEEIKMDTDNFVTGENIYETISLQNRSQIFNAISRAGGYIKAATIYSDGDEKRFEPCALCRNELWHMWIDHLPTTGYRNTNLDVEEAVNIYTVFTHLPITYQQAVFCGEEKKLVLVIPKENEARRCKIQKWVNHGYYTTFEVKCDGEDGNRTLGGHNYGKDWIFLDPLT